MLCGRVSTSHRQVARRLRSWHFRHNKNTCAKADCFEYALLSTGAGGGVYVTSVVGEGSFLVLLSFLVYVGPDRCQVQACAQTSSAQKIATEEKVDARGARARLRVGCLNAPAPPGRAHRGTLAASSFHPLWAPKSLMCASLFLQT